MPDLSSEIPTEPRAEKSAEPAGAVPQRSVRSRFADALSFRRISAIYVFIVLFILFSLWVPDTFLTLATWRTMLDNESVTALLAIALVIPLAAGCPNLAIGSELGLGAILVAWFLAKRGIPIVPSIALVLIAGALIGVVNGLLVARAKIDSFIATLGVSSVLAAMISWIAQSQQILNLGSSFQSIGTGELFGITYPVYIVLVVAIIAFYVLERTPVGRRVYATGGNLEAARLAGVRTQAVIIGTFIACGAIAVMAGVLESSKLAVGDPTIGPTYLLPAFAAVFLGSTQFHGGRYNVAGTVVSVYVLATGVKGLQLAGAPVWLPELFNGLALLIAVGMTRYSRTASRAGAIARTIGRGRRRSKGDAEPGLAPGS